MQWPSNPIQGCNHLASDNNLQRKDPLASLSGADVASFVDCGIGDAKEVVQEGEEEERSVVGVAGRLVLSLSPLFFTF